MNDHFHLKEIETIDDITCKRCLFFKQSSDMIFCLKGSGKCEIDGVCAAGKWILWKEGEILGSFPYEDCIEEFYKEQIKNDGDRILVEMLVPVGKNK